MKININKKKEKDIYWARVLVRWQNACPACIGLEPQHYINQVWWPVTPAIRRQGLEV